MSLLIILALKMMNDLNIPEFYILMIIAHLLALLPDPKVNPPQKDVVTQPAPTHQWAVSRKPALLKGSVICPCPSHEWSV
jgi:hypothetical protein